MAHKALVTGGAGFIGSHLVDYLIHPLDMDVVVLDDLSGGFTDNLNPKARFVQGSVVDQELVVKLFEQERFDFVYHLAAYAAEGLSHFIKHFNYTNNVIGSVNLINASINTDVKRFVFTSSIAVYGANQVPMTEDLIPAPEDSYGIAKYAVEMELRASREMFSLPYTIFRPHNVYGERQNLGDKYRNVAGIFMNRLMQGQDLIIFGDGEQRRAFTYIGDIVPGLARSVFVKESVNQVFNIGADQPYTVNELAAIIMEAMGKQVPLRHVEARNEVKIAYSDHGKFQQVFPDSPGTPLPDGIRRMAVWATEAGIRKSKDFDNIEIRKNLPPAWVAP